MRTKEPRRTQTLREHLPLPPFSAPPPPRVLPPPPVAASVPPLSQGLSSESLGAPLDGPLPQDPQPQRLSRCRVEDGMRPPHGHAPTPRPATVPSPPPPPALPPPRNDHQARSARSARPLTYSSHYEITHTLTEGDVSESICLTVKLCTQQRSYTSSPSPTGFSPSLFTACLLHRNASTNTHSRSPTASLALNERRSLLELLFYVNSLCLYFLTSLVSAFFTSTSLFPP